LKISITLPSLFPNALAETVKNIMAASRSVDYEIIVVSPFEVSGPRIVWVREETPSGNCPAHRAAFAHASGDFVVAMSDDARLSAGWADVCLRHVLARESGAGNGLLLGLNQSNLVIGSVFGIYYPFFPFGRRGLIESVGGYFSDAYFAHFGDPDLALRVWSGGGRCEFTADPLIDRIERDAAPGAGRIKAAGPAQTHKETALERDAKTFVSRWKEKFGAHWPTAEIRDFNIDLNIGHQLMLARDHSVFVNDPVVRRLVDNYAANIGKWKFTMEPAGAPAG
jgi:hypothetical protein